MATKATASTAAAAESDGKAGPTAIGGLEMTKTPVAPAASGSSSTTTSSSKAAPPSAGAGAKKGGAGRSVDMWAHNGLRGVAAVWIVVFHCYGLPKRSELSLNLQGHTLMPLFFLLSGFTLAATYGRKRWAAPSPCCDRSQPQKQPQQPPAGSPNQTTSTPDAAAVEEGRVQGAPQQQPEQAQLPHFPLRSFYQNRFARVMPVYYFCLLLCLPLWGLNVGDLPFSRKTFVPSLLTSVFPSTTLFSGAPLATLNPPGWFVCTLVWFFLLFPRWLPKAQQLSDAQLLNRIVGLFYLQYALLQGIFFLGPLVIPGFRPFGLATSNPLTRWPLFLMGIYAGLLALRHPATPGPTTTTTTTTTPPTVKSAAGEPTTAVAAAAAAGGSPTMAAGTGSAGGATEQHMQQTEAAAVAVMPWTACFLGFFPVPPAIAASRCGRAIFLPLSTKPPATQRDWAWVATWHGVGLFLFTLAVAAAESAAALATQRRVVLSGHVWAQALVPMAQLTILLALTRDGRRSLASRALGTRFAQWLGKVSMDVYLVHWPIIAYTALALHGPRRFETLLDCYGAVDAREEDPAHYEECLQAMAAAKRFPPWGVCVVLPLSLAAGELLYRYVNEPARKLLRARESEGSRSAAAAVNAAKPAKAAAGEE